MFAIFKKYRHLLSRRAADDFNRISAFLTNLCGDQSIDLHRPDNPTAENPPSIRVNEDWLDEKLEDKGSDTTPLKDSASGSAGNSDSFSRGDHRHPINVDTTNNPKDIGTAASKGTATTYARSDHVHRVADNGATKISLTSYFSSGSWTQDTGTWTRGVTKSNNVLCGGSMTIPTRMVILGGNQAGYTRIAWRTIQWDQNGCIVKVTAEETNTAVVINSV